MAELAALGVAASIAQFVALGLKGAALVWKVYESADGLLEDQKDLLLVSQDVQERCRLLQAEPLGQIDANLEKLLHLARSLAIDLEAELDKLKRASNAGPVSKVRQILRVLRRKSRIEDVQRRLLKLRDQIILSLLTTTRQARTGVAHSSTINSDHFDGFGQMSSELQGISRNLQDVKGVLSSRKDIGEKFETLTADIERFTSRALLRHRMERILKSLHFKQISHRLGTIPKAHESTFQWGLYGDRTTFPNWLSAGSGIFWIEGKAGSGKSTLMKYLTREDKTLELLRHWAQNRSLVIVKHFFWAPGSELQRGLDGLFRTMLFQILMEHPELISKVCPQRVDKSCFRYLESWTVEELKGCFQSLAALPSLPSKFCFFIDGLDEYRGNPQELIAIIDFIAKSDDMKLCVSSRPWVEFRQAFSHLKWQLHVHDLTHDDIVRYVQDNLAESDYYQALRVQYPEDAESFQAEIASKAKGVFFWVYLVTRSLVRGLQHQDNISTLRRRLAAFPTELEGYFMTMLESIDPIHQEESSEVLSVLAYSQANVPVRVLRACLDMQQIAKNVDHMAMCNKPPITATSKSLSSTYRSLRSSMDQHSHQLSSGYIASDFRIANPIMERCKDLVFVYVDSERVGYEVSIGFLHRSVADFLALPQVDALLKNRVRREFDVRLALVRAYMTMMRFHLKSVILENEHWFLENDLGPSLMNEPHYDMAEMFFLKALYEALQLKAISEAHYDRATLFIAFCFIGSELEFFRKAIQLDSVWHNVRARKATCVDDLRHQGASSMENLFSAADFQLPNLLKQCFRHIGCHFISGDYYLGGDLQLGGRLINRLGLEVPFDNEAFADCCENQINLGDDELAAREKIKLPSERLFMVSDSLNKQLVITSSEVDEPKLQELDTIDLTRLEEIVSASPLRDSTSASNIERNYYWVTCLQQITRLDGDTWPMNLYQAVEILILRGVPRYIFLKRERRENADRVPYWSYDLPAAHNNASEKRIWTAAKDLIDETIFIRVDSAKLLEQIPVIASKSPNGMADLFSDENPQGELPWLDSSLAESQPSLFKSGQALFKYFFS